MQQFLRMVLLFGLILAGATACNGSEPEQAEPTAAPSTPTQVAASPVPPTTTPIATLPPLTPQAGGGAAKGSIVAFPASWAGRQLFVYFAPFLSDKGTDEGIFVLDPSSHPSTPVASDGMFQLANIPPGRYVVVIGPTPGEALAIRRGDIPQIFEVVEGQILDLGQLSLE